MEPGGEPLQASWSVDATLITNGPVPGMAKPIVGDVLAHVPALEASRKACAKLPAPDAFALVTQNTGVGEGGGTAVQAPNACWASAPARAATRGEYR